MFKLSLLLFLSFIIVLAKSSDPTDTAFSPLDSFAEYPKNSLYQPGALFPLGGMMPSARVHHTIAATEDYIIVYGGYYSDGSLLGDINVFHFLTQQWSGPITRVECCNAVGSLVETIGSDGQYVLPYLGIGFEGDFPLPRAEHGVATILDDMYIFGGVTYPYGFSQDLYKFDSISLTWSAVNQISSAAPSRRAGHSMVSDSSNNHQHLYVFGGRSLRGGKKTGNNDVWRFDVIDSTWTLLSKSPNAVRDSPTPANRQHASFGFLNEKLFVFGGMDPASNVTFNDVWVFNIEEASWEQLSRNSGSNRGFAPPPLFNAYMIPIVPTVRNVNNTEITGFIIYGGIGGGGQCADFSCRLQTVLGQAYRFSMTSNTWEYSKQVESSSYTKGRYINSSSWEYARLSAGGEGFDTQANDRGKFVKLYALEKAVYVPKQNRMYEFGGIQSASTLFPFAGQSGPLEFSINHDFIATIYLGAGGNLLEVRTGDVGGIYAASAQTENGEAELWDVSTGEQLRTTVDVPTTTKWQFDDAFSKDYAATAERSGVVVDRSRTSSAAGGAYNSTVVQLLRSFRVYSVNPTDVVLMKEDVFVSA